jgi:hypothetical protein
MDLCSHFWLWLWRLLRHAGTQFRIVHDGDTTVQAFRTLIGHVSAAKQFGTGRIVALMPQRGGDAQGIPKQIEPKARGSVYRGVHLLIKVAIQVTPLMGRDAASTPVVAVVRYHLPAVRTTMAKERIAATAKRIATEPSNAGTLHAPATAIGVGIGVISSSIMSTIMTRRRGTKIIRQQCFAFSKDIEKLTPLRTGEKTKWLFIIIASQASSFAGCRCHCHFKVEDK